MLCQMNEPFLPTYDFDDIPTDAEVMDEKIKQLKPYPDSMVIGKGVYVTEKTFQDYLNDATLPKAPAGSFDVRAYAQKALNDNVGKIMQNLLRAKSFSTDKVRLIDRDVVLLNNTYEITTAEYYDALDIGMTYEQIIAKCEAYTKGEIA